MKREHLAVPFAFAAAYLIACLTVAVEAWEIRTTGPVTIIGEGAYPYLVTPSPLPTPPVVPPTTPPPAVEDSSPFVWPTTCPPSLPESGAEHNWALGPERFYAKAAAEGAISGLRCAGILGPDARASWGGNIAGLTLWVPPTANPATIRAALRRGYIGTP